MSSVKKIFCLRSQDKIAPKFSHLSNITHCPFNTSPHKEISRLRSKKFNKETVFLSIKYILCFQILKRVSPSVHLFRFKNTAVKGHSQFIQVNLQGHFHHVSHSRMTRPHGRCGIVIFLLRCRDCSQSVATNRSLTTTKKLYQAAGSWS
jgi:hypothetical protein